MLYNYKVLGYFLTRDFFFFSIMERISHVYVYRIVKHKNSKIVSLGKMHTHFFLLLQSNLIQLIKTLPFYFNNVTCVQKLCILQ